MCLPTRTRYLQLPHRRPSVRLDDSDASPDLASCRLLHECYKRAGNGSFIELVSVGVCTLRLSACEYIGDHFLGRAHGSMKWVRVLADVDNVAIYVNRC